MALKLDIKIFNSSLIPLDFEMGLSREITAVQIFICSRIKGLDPRWELVKWDMQYLAEQMYPNSSKDFIDAAVKFLLHSFELDDLYLENLKGQRRNEVCFACIDALDKFLDGYTTAQFPKTESEIDRVVDTVKTKYKSDLYVVKTLQSMFNSCLAMLPILESVEDRRSYLPDMIESWKLTLEGIRIEQIFSGEKARIPTKKEYWQYRVLGSAGGLHLVKLCYCIDGDYSKKKGIRAKVRQLEELICYQLAVQNDLVSLKKDLKNNHNLNWVMICKKDIKKAEADYHQATRKIKAWPTGSFETVVVALKDVGLGCSRWQSRAMRYSRLMQLFCYQT